MSEQIDFTNWVKCWYCPKSSGKMKDGTLCEVCKGKGGKEKEKENK